MKLDAHQQAIITAAVARYHLPLEQREPESSVVNVQAVAGAGKSVIITELTRRLSSASFLFLCFSPSIADRARATLPPSVSVATFEEAARAFVMRTHPMKVTATKMLPRTLPDRAIQQATELQASTKETRIIRRSLQLFYQSSSGNLDNNHVEEALGSLGYDTPGLATPILRMARMVWQSQTRRSDTSAPVCQGAMLKLWTLGRQEVRYESDRRSTPRGGDNHASGEMLSPLGDAEVVVIEEAQDLTEAMIGFLGRQNRVVLMFGDAMQTLQKRVAAAEQNHSLQTRGHCVALPRSYRFGATIAGILTTLQQRCLGEASAPIEGRPELPSEVSLYHPAALQPWIDQGAPLTVIGASIIDILPLLMAHPGARVGWIDGLVSPAYHYQTVWDIACLTAPADHPIRKRIQNRWIREAGTLERLHEQLSQRQAYLSVHICEWVMANRHSPLLRTLEQLRSNDSGYQHALVEDASRVAAPAITFATPTTAKGHEWPTVAVTPSLTSALNYLPKADALNDSQKRQVRSLYTAISRAQHTLLVPEDVITFATGQGAAVEVTPIENARRIAFQEQEHPYFGLSRHRVLEMTAASRKARRQRYKRQQELARTRRQQRDDSAAAPRDAEHARQHLAAMKQLVRG